MKTKPLLLLAATILVLGVSGCEKAETKEAHLNGMIVTDLNGRKWMLRHNLVDTYFIASVNADGSVNLP